MDKDKKSIKREMIPLIIAVTILLVLVIALIYTIFNKPKDNQTKNNENSLVVEEVSIGNANYVCEGKDINKLKEDASKVYVTYEELDHYYLGKDENPDVVSDNDTMEEVYGDALRVKVFGITDGIFVKIKDENEEEKQNVELYKEDVTKDSFAKYEKTFLSSQSKINVRIYVDDENCKNILLREFNITLPRYNPLSTNELCELESNKGIDACKKYVFNDNDYDDDLKEITKERKEYPNSTKEEKKDSNKSNGIWFVIGGIIVIGIVGVIYMKGMKKNA